MFQMTTTVIFPLSISNQEEENILKREEELEESVTFEEDDESKGEDVRREQQIHGLHFPVSISKCVT